MKTFGWLGLSPQKASLEAVAPAKRTAGLVSFCSLIRSRKLSLRSAFAEPMFFLAGIAAPKIYFAQKLPPQGPFGFVVEVFANFFLLPESYNFSVREAVHYLVGASFIAIEETGEVFATTLKLPLSE